VREVKFPSTFACVGGLIIFFILGISPSKAGIVPLARVPVSFPTDIAFDDARGDLLITSQEVAPLHSQVLRYNVASGTMRAALAGPSNARYWGVTIAPDQRYVYAADRFNARVTRFDLLTGAVDNIVTQQSPGLLITGFDVNVSASGVGLITTSFAGSGFVQLQRFEPGSLTTTALTGNTFPIRNYNQTAMLSDAGGRSIYFVQTGLGGGVEMARFDGTSNSFSPPLAFNHVDAKAAVNGDGTRFAASNGNTIWMWDQQLQQVHSWTEPGLRGPVAINPATDEIYALARVSGVDQVWIYDTGSLTRKAAFDVGEVVDMWENGWPFGGGRMSFSADGTYFFLATQASIRIYAVPEPSTAATTMTLAILCVRRRRR
jgi:hypothetical protein